MCLEIEINRPNDVLSRGSHKGFEFITVNNGGYRCGYVKVEECHPWHGKATCFDDCGIKCHGGVTFSGHDMLCNKGGADTGYWVGFDCAHNNDAPDPELPSTGYEMPELAVNFFGKDGIVRSQEYVENECRSICEQAEKAVQK